MLDGYVSHLQAKVTPECVFDSEDGQFADLYLHSGDKVDPVLCAPDLPKSDAIPISRLMIKGKFTDNCTKLEGSLVGCLSKASAGKICMCILGDCQAPAPDPNSSDYCQRNCGPHINFGANLNELPLNCHSDKVGSCMGDECDAWTFSQDFGADLIPEAKML
jgi:hypothetical protein